MVWALRGATDVDVVVPAEFVSICNNKGRLASQLLQIETEGWRLVKVLNL